MSESELKPGKVPCPDGCLHCRITNVLKTAADSMPASEVLDALVAVSVDIAMTFEQDEMKIGTGTYVAKTLTGTLVTAMKAAGTQEPVFEISFPTRGCPHCAVKSVLSFFCMDGETFLESMSDVVAEDIMTRIKSMETYSGESSAPDLPSRLAQIFNEQVLAKIDAVKQESVMPTHDEFASNWKH